MRLVDGTKTIETRRYTLPDASRYGYMYVGREMHVLETPAWVPGVAPTAGRSVLTLKACSEHGMQYVGVVRFGQPFRYASRAEWERDAPHHGVERGSPYGWQAIVEDGGGEIWGYPVCTRLRYAPPRAPMAPLRRVLRSIWTTDPLTT